MRAALSPRGNVGSGRTGGPNSGGLEIGAHHTITPGKTEGEAIKTARSQGVAGGLLLPKHGTDNLAAAANGILADQFFFYRHLFE